LGDLLLWQLLLLLKELLLSKLLLLKVYRMRPRHLRRVHIPIQVEPRVVLSVVVALKSRGQRARVGRRQDTRHRQRKCR
jgi:hypothetical protein